MDPTDPTGLYESQVKADFFGLKDRIFARLPPTLVTEMGQALTDEAAGKSGTFSALIDRYEATRVFKKQDVYDAIIAFIPWNQDTPEGERLFDLLADCGDGFVGWCHPNYRRFADEPDCKAPTDVCREPGTTRG